MAKLLDKLKSFLPIYNISIKKQSEEIYRLRKDKDNANRELFSLRKDKDLLLDSLSIALKSIADTFITTSNAKQVYEIIKALDSEGYILYDTCKNILKCDVRKEFTSDESLGRFEMANGFGMKHYAEIFYFGNYDFEYVGCYEILGKYEIDYTTPQYLAYEQELWTKAVANVLKSFEIGAYEDIPEIFKSLLDLKSSQENLTLQPQIS